MAFNLFLKACDKIAGKPNSYLAGEAIDNIVVKSASESWHNV